MSKKTQTSSGTIKRSPIRSLKLERHGTHVISYRYFPHEFTPTRLASGFLLPQYVAKPMSNGITPRALENAMEESPITDVARDLGTTVHDLRLLLERWGIPDHPIHCQSAQPPKIEHRKFPPKKPKGIDTQSKTA